MCVLFEEPIRGELPARSISAPSTRSFRSDEAGVAASGGEAQRTVGKNRNININIKRLKDFYIYKNPALIHQYLDRANSYRHPNPAVGASVSAAYSKGGYSLKNRYNNAKSSEEEESEESAPSAQSYDKYEGEKYYPAKSGKYQNKYDSDGSYVHPDGYKPVRPHDEQDKKYTDGAASKSDKPKMKTTQTTSRSNNGHALKNEEYEVYNKIEEYKPKSKEYKSKKEEQPSYEKRREEPEEEEEEERAQQSYVDSSKEYAKMGGEAPSRNKSSSPSAPADQNAYSKSKEKIRLDVETFFNTLLEWAKKQKQLYMPESSRVPSSSMPKRRESNEYPQNQSDKSSKYGQSGEEGKRQRGKESNEAKPHPDGYKPVKTTVKPSVNSNARYSEEYE